MQANYLCGWREILARVFDGFDVEYGVTPEWLINPDTNRRLKLDLLYPQVAIAVRFVGVEGGGRRRRKSDEEVASEADREEARAAVCRHNGIVLVSISPDGEPRTELRKLEFGLSRATSQMAQAQISQDTKLQLMPPVEYCPPASWRIHDKAGSAREIESVRRDVAGSRGVAGRRRASQTDDRSTTSLQTRDAGGARSVWRRRNHRT